MTNGGVARVNRLSALINANQEGGTQGLRDSGRGRMRNSEKTRLTDGVPGAIDVGKQECAAEGDDCYEEGYGENRAQEGLTKSNDEQGGDQGEQQPTQWSDEKNSPSGKWKMSAEEQLTKLRNGEAQSDAARGTCRSRDPVECIAFHGFWSALRYQPQLRGREAQGGDNGMSRAEVLLNGRGRKET